MITMVQFHVTYILPLLRKRNDCFFGWKHAYVSWLWCWLLKIYTWGIISKNYKLPLPLQKTTCENWQNLNRVCPRVNNMVPISVSWFWQCTMVTLDIIDGGHSAMVHRDSTVLQFLMTQTIKKKKLQLTLITSIAMSYEVTGTLHWWTAKCCSWEKSRARSWGPLATLSLTSQHITC